MPVIPGLQRLAPRVYVHAPGLAAPPLPAGAIALAQRPGPAFGDGRHPTTRLCAGAVDLLLRQRCPPAVLDVGTGTGILARIARARGAARIVATDIDPVALLAARSNAALDDHPITIEIDDRLPDHDGPIFTLVVANILEGPLRQLAPALRGALAPGGALLLSGVTPAQVPALQAAFVHGDLRLVSHATLDGWSLLMLRRGDPAESR